MQVTIELTTDLALKNSVCEENIIINICGVEAEIKIDDLKLAIRKLTAK